MMRLGLSIVVAATLAACQPQAEAPAAPDTTPRRIVSLDYCADQYVLKLVEPERILAVSEDAERPFSYMREAAKGVPKVRSSVEDVLALKPDLIVRAYGGGPQAGTFLERAGIPVLKVGFSRSLDAAKMVIRDIANGLHAKAAGAAVIADMEMRLKALAHSASGKSVLYMTPAGVTTGPGSDVHEMILAAGLQNFQTEAGWRPLPLERLTHEQPDLIAASFFDAKTNHPNAWSAMRHPVARKQLRDVPTVYLDGAWTACGGWNWMDAIEAMAAGAQGL
ncbi:MAG: ABC transporter substrate-binding protein [Sphingomonadales bacterium]